MQHRAASKPALAHVQSVIIYKNEELSLWHKKTDDFSLIASKVIINDYYRLLKNITHIPVLIRMHDIPYTAEKKSALKKEQDEMKVITNNLEVSAEDYETQMQILKKSEAFLSWALSCEEVAIKWQKKLDQYTASLQDEIDHNCRRTTQIQLTHLHETLNNWQEDYALKMENSRTIIVGPHGPRNGLIEKQYFLELYKNVLGIKNAENDRLYYVESLPTHIAKINIKSDLIDGFLGLAELNKSLGVVAKDGSPKTMFSDILKNYAPSVLSGFFKVNRS